MKVAQLLNSTIAIVGMGIEGQATYQYLRSRLPHQRLTVADLKPVSSFEPEVQRAWRDDSDLELKLGYRDLTFLRDYSVVFRSPGMPPQLLAGHLSADARVTSLTDLFLDEYPGKVIGVTGTKGKSTTATLIATLLTTAGRDVSLGGNIGRPPLRTLEHASVSSVCVYEMSSHQLADLERSPDIAVLLNIYPEHLDYYSTMDAYIAAKARIAEFQSPRDWLVYNAGDPIVTSIAKRSPAQLVGFSAQLDSGAIYSLRDGFFTRPSGGARPERIAERSSLALAGRFNAADALAALAVADILLLEASSLARGLEAAHPLPHRMERLGWYRGILFVDNSIGTIPQTTMDGAQALSEDGYRVGTLLLGGGDRGLNYSVLADWLLDSGVVAVALFPPAGPRIREAVTSAARSRGAEAPALHDVESMAEAVDVAYRWTPTGHACLFSPAAPSAGEYQHFWQRGEAFRREVEGRGGSYEPR